ncbi:MAG: hypothetical protein V4636_02185 [Pseudomonadota bacterium]
MSFNHDVVSEKPACRGFGLLPSCAGRLIVALYIGISGTAQTALLIFGALGICGVTALVSMSRCVRAHSALQQDHRRLRAEREEQAKLLQEALDAKTNFLAAASQELRQPAQALGLFVDELRPSPQSTPIRAGW